MLQHLYIRNYALFAEVDIDFPNGLVILTGETGAGKSLLIGALGLVMGKRADSSVIFREEEKCVVEARFHRLSPPILARLGQQEAFDLEGDALRIRREINPSGKSRAFVNDTPVTLDVLRDISSLLVDLHGQHENVSLVQADRQRELVDQYAGNQALLEAFAQQLKATEALQREIKTLKTKEEEAKTQLEYLHFQRHDLENAGVQADEEQELEDELKLLQNSEEIREALGGGAEILYHQEESVYALLSSVLDPLKKVRSVSNSLEEEVGKLEAISEQLKESALSLQHLLESVESDPERLAFIEDRLAVYHQLKLKYHKRNGAELVALLASVKEQIGAYDSLEDEIRQKEQQFQRERQQLAELGQQVEASRLAVKAQLEQEILGVLHQVGFQKSRFEVAVERQDHADGWLELAGKRLKPGPDGFNKVYFLIQTNPGMPAGPLGQIASGGEISRVMLAIKTALAGKSDFPVLIFDEIDTGISGEIANKVGEVMRQLAQRFQILSITHLPQIAAKGHSHYKIHKEVQNDMTTSTVAPLDPEARVHEIAVMLSGETPSDSAMRNATELMAG